MKELFLIIRNWLVIYKVSSGRVSSYLTMFMMIAIILKQFNVKLLFYPIGFVIFGIIIMVLGYLDNILGLHREETRINTSRCPIHEEMMKLLKEIKDKIIRR